jgi:hypothetical protein
MFVLFIPIDFENYNSCRKPASQKMNTIKLRDSCSPKSCLLCSAQASKTTSNV